MSIFNLPCTGGPGRASYPVEAITMEKLFPRSGLIWKQNREKQKEVEEFLKSAQPLAEKESGTIAWYAVKIDASHYGIFDTFADEAGRNAHISGDIAKALFAKAKDLSSRKIRRFISQRFWRRRVPAAQKARRVDKSQKTSREVWRSSAPRVSRPVNSAGSLRHFTPA